MHPKLPDRVTRVAVVRALHVGDLLTSVPGLRALRSAFPDAEITLIGLPWARDLVHRLPYLDRLLEFPGYPGIVEAPYSSMRTQVFLEEAQDYGYDLAIQLHGDGTVSSLFTLELGAHCTAGYFAPRRGIPVLDISLPFPDRYPEILRVLDLMTHLGCVSRGTYCEFPLQRVEQKEAIRLLEAEGWREGQTLIGFNPGARAPARRWRPERFGAVANGLMAETGALAVVTGTSAERELAARVADTVRGRCINLAGRTHLGTLAAVISRLSLLVTNDSGPAHVAEAVGTPSVILFGGADPNRWAPLDKERHAVLCAGVECSPCPHWQCPIDHRCLENIEPADVLASALRLLNRTGGRTTDDRPYIPEDMCPMFEQPGG